MIFHLSSNLIFTGFAASGGQGRSENAASELLSLSHKSLLPWGLFSQSKSLGHGWLMSWILHVASEGRGTEHILGHLWHLLLLAKWGEQPKCEGYVPWLWVRPECEKNLWSKTRSKLGVVGSVRCHRVHFTMLSSSNKDSMAPHYVSEPTLVPLFYTAPNPCQGNSRSCKSKTSWTINQFFWLSISFRRKEKKKGEKALPKKPTALPCHISICVLKECFQNKVYQLSKPCAYACICLCICSQT